jgi:hypothetical protein
MNRSHTLASATQKLRRIVTPELRDHDSHWADDVYAALGDLAAAIQAQVQVSDQSRQLVGAINPDFQNNPTLDRHVESARERLIGLGEQVHQLRGDMRASHVHLPLNKVQARLRCLEIASAIEEASRSDDKFLLETTNLNPGAGE